MKNTRHLDSSKMINLATLRTAKGAILDRVRRLNHSECQTLPKNLWTTLCGKSELWASLEIQSSIGFLQPLYFLTFNQNGIGKLPKKSGINHKKLVLNQKPWQKRGYKSFLMASKMKLRRKLPLRRLTTEKSSLWSSMQEETSRGLRTSRRTNFTSFQKPKLCEPPRNLRPVQIHSIAMTKAWLRFWSTYLGLMTTNLWGWSTAQRYCQ